jgi:hypothetical protein
LTVIGEFFPQNRPQCPNFGQGGASGTSVSYDILTGGCVLHWVTALERIVNILQDKMGPDFERERHIDMLHVRAINFHKRQFTAQNVATLLTQASREYGQSTSLSVLMLPS